MAVKKIKLEQTGSIIGRKSDQEATLLGLGLKRRHRVVEVLDTPENRGMINKVKHLVKIIEENK
jgi:large subunit ribosomal protein L30